MYLPGYVFGGPGKEVFFKLNHFNDVYHEAKVTSYASYVTMFVTTPTREEEEKKEKSY